MSDANRSVMRQSGHSDSGLLPSQTMTRPKHLPTDSTFEVRLGRLWADNTSQLPEPVRATARIATFRLTFQEMWVAALKAKREGDPIIMFDWEADDLLTIDEWAIHTKHGVRVERRALLTLPGDLIAAAGRLVDATFGSAREQRTALPREAVSRVDENLLDRAFAVLAP